MKCLKHLILAVLLLSSLASKAADEVSPYQKERTVRALSYPFPYSPERLAFHDQLISKITEGTRKQVSPKIIFFAGGYGTGKTYTLSQLQNAGVIEKGHFVVINPDEIREEIPEYQNLKAMNHSEPGTPVQTETLDIADVALENSLRNGKNIVLDSSLQNTEHYEKFFKYIRKIYPNYQIEIVHVKAPVAQSVKLANERALTDGRKLSEQMIRETAQKSEQTVSQLRSQANRFTEVTNIIGSPLKGTTEIIPHAVPAGTKHIIFDIDWTLVSPYHTQLPNDWRFVKVQGEIYRVTDHVGEIMKRLSSRKNVMISFFSGGDYARNIELLQAIKPPELGGQSLYDLAYRILSKEDLKLINANAKGFDHKFQKDAHLITQDIKNSALVDDAPGFLEHSGAGKVSLGDAYDHFENYAEIHNQKPYLGKPKYRPRSEKAFRAFRDRLARAFGILDEALDESETSKLHFRGLIDEKNAIPGDHYLEEGRKKLKQASPVSTIAASAGPCVFPILNAIP